MSFEISTGSIFADRYRIEREIASGGMGAVYKVVHLETNRRRALKVLHAKYVNNEQLRGRFRQEARVASEVDSEHIVNVFDAGIDSATGMPFLGMELFRGEDSRARLRSVGRLSAHETVALLFQAALGLDATHQAQIVHRDLKPDNLFLCERGQSSTRVKLLDFGIAKMLAEGQFQGQTNEALGTPHYMAPEQFLMNGQPSSATDIYALGLIAYMMLVGKPYRLEESTKVSSVVVFAVEAVKGPRESPVIRASRHDVTLPDAFDAWFFCVAAPNPSERFTTATEAVTALAVVLDVPLPDETSLVGVMGPSSRNAFGSASDLASSRSVSVTVSGSIPSTLSEPTLLDTTSPAKASDAFRRSFTPIALSILVALGVGTFVSYKVFYRPPPDEPVASQVDSMSIPSASVPQVRPVVAADSVAVEPQAPPFNSWFGSAPASAAPMSEASVATTKSAVRSKDKPNSTRSATVKKAGRRGLWSND